MNNFNSGKELVIKEIDNIIEYKDRTSNNIQQPLSIKEQRVNNRLELYKTLLSKDEFKRPETKETILDEDDYLNSLEVIIQRDFFPHLYEKRMKDEVSKSFKQLINSDYTNPLESERYDNLDKLNREYLAQRDGKSKKINTDNFDIDSYCMNYTSDEIESLKDILYKDKKAQLKKNFWMYEQENKANSKLLALKEYSEEYLKLPDKVILYLIIGSYKVPKTKCFMC
jgi:hypothetical protein